MYRRAIDEQRKVMDEISEHFWAIHNKIRYGLSQRLWNPQFTTDDVGLKVSIMGYHAIPFWMLNMSFLIRPYEMKSKNWNIHKCFRGGTMGGWNNEQGNMGVSWYQESLPYGKP